MIIYAVTNGHLDDIPVERVRAFEVGFQQYMRAQHPEVGQAIREQKKMSEEVEQQLVAGIEAFKATFLDEVSETAAEA